MKAAKASLTKAGPYRYTQVNLHGWNRETFDSDWGHGLLCFWIPITFLESFPPHSVRLLSFSLE